MNTTDGGRRRLYLDELKGEIIDCDWDDIPPVNPAGSERIGYPTQKPEALLERIILSTTSIGETVADFFLGDGTTPAVAQRLGRRWIACDQSRVAVAITADRLAKAADQLKLAWQGPGGTGVRGTGVPPVNNLTLGQDAQATRGTGVPPVVTPTHGQDAHAAFAPVPDFTIEHWGVYEAKRLSETPPDQFREFILRAFGATPESGMGGRSRDHGQDVRATGARATDARATDAPSTIHGYKGAVPVWVGEPAIHSQVTAKDVEEFANAIRQSAAYQQANLRDGVMLAWAFRPDAIEAAQRLRMLGQTDLNFIRLDMVRIDDRPFREHIAALTTDHADYENFLTFIQPPQVHVAWKRLGTRLFVFDVSDTVLLNSGAKIINVQWDFRYDGTFRTTQGYSFLRTSRKEPELQAQYEFDGAGRNRVACRVQDDMGGEGFWVGVVDVC